MVQAKQFLKFSLAALFTLGLLAPSLSANEMEINRRGPHKTIKKLEKASKNFYYQANNDCSNLGHKAKNLVKQVKQLKKAVKKYGMNSYPALKQFNDVKEAYFKVNTAMYRTNVSYATKNQFEKVERAMKRLVRKFY